MGGKVFASMKSNPTHFHVLANFFVNEFHTVANGWESVCFHVLMKHKLWSESIVTWQSVKQQLSWQA
jgi:hypothetical protein